MGLQPVPANVLFLLAPDIGSVIAGRIVQGVATGAASSALTAALVEVAPANRKRHPAPPAPSDR